MLNVLTDLNNKIKEEHEFSLARIFDLLPMPVLITQKRDNKFVNTFVNQKFNQIIGYNLEQISTPEKWFEKAYPNQVYREEVLVLMNQKTEVNTIENSSTLLHTLITTASGTEKWFETKVALWSPQFSVSVFIDVNDIKNQKRNLERLNRLKDRMITLISHDFRSPLVNIKGLIDLLCDDRISRDEFKKLVPSVLSQLNSTFNLLDDLLLWAKNQFENPTDNQTCCNIKAIIDETLGLFIPIADAKKIKLEYFVNQNASLHLNKEKLKLVIRNILSNAIKFTHPGGMVLISHYIKNQHLVISIKDNGIGMTEHQLNALFYHRPTQNLGTGNEEGTGLGFILCLDAIESFGGKISATSKPDLGTEFIIQIPLHN